MPSHDRILDCVQVVDQDDRRAVDQPYAQPPKPGRSAVAAGNRIMGSASIRADKIDFVICFICECMHVFRDAGSDEYKWADISGHPEATLDELLIKAARTFASQDGASS